MCHLATLTVMMAGQKRGNRALVGNNQIHNNAQSLKFLSLPMMEKGGLPSF
jgi:hypothetical protein